MYYIQMTISSSKKTETFDGVDIEQMLNIIENVHLDPKDDPNGYLNPKDDPENYVGTIKDIQTQFIKKERGGKIQERQVLDAYKKADCVSKYAAELLDLTNTQFRHIVNRMPGMQNKMKKLKKLQIELGFDKPKFKPDDLHLTDKQIKAVRHNVELGLPIRSIADLLEIPRTKFMRALTNDEKLNKEYKKGLALRHKLIATTAMQHMLNGDKGMCIFLCKSQLGWQERSTIEHKGNIEGGAMKTVIIDENTDISEALVSYTDIRSGIAQLEDNPEKNESTENK